MNGVKRAANSSLIEVLVSEPVVVFVITLNAIALFLDAFPEIHAEYGRVFACVDYACITFFFVEAMLKILGQGFSKYWSNSWNRFDFIVIIFCVPILIDTLMPGESKPFALITILRMGRFLRFIRLMRFIPNAEHIWAGIGRALRASVGVFLVLLLLNLILAVGATILFGHLPAPAPDYFGDPFTSLYTMFKVFTVEGWYEVPDRLAEGNVSPDTILMVRVYFVGSVLVGGILGLSLANAVFVDEMTTDNNDKLENMVEELRDELKLYRAELSEALEQLRDAKSNR